MAELIAEGENREQRWQRSLPPRQAVVVGKDPQVWAVPWEPWISGRHVEVVLEAGRLTVRRVSSALNPVFFRGREAESFEMKNGDCFVIGRTAFTFHDGAEPSSARGRKLAQAYSIGVEQLQEIAFRDAPHRIDVLGHLSQVIGGVADRGELYAQTVNLLLEGIRRADAIAMVAAAPGAVSSEVRTLHTDHRIATGSELQPSRRLVLEAIVNLKKSVVHVWSPDHDAGSEPFTMRNKFDWAFCTPLRGDACEGMGLYVAGQLMPGAASFDRSSAEAGDLDEDVKFAELVATILSSLLEVQTLQHRQSVLGHFFSPNVLQVLTTTEPEKILAPRETEVTVMFCDLQGFSGKVEAAADQLLSILERVSRALGIMSRGILDHRGVVADFLGDSAMGFWGWPLASEDDIPQACRAAMIIHETFDELSRQAENPLYGFMAGVGIATGRAVAGQIGTQDQVKVTVFGPCANLASRLEGLTRILRVPILLDEATAKVARERLPAEAARCRRLALVKPYGLAAPVMVSELRPPAERDTRQSDEHLAKYDAALTDFLSGQWEAAEARLRELPSDDPGRELLMGFMLQHNHAPPPGWDGVIPIRRKG